MLKRIGSLIEEVLEGIVPTQSTQITSIKPDLYPEFDLRSPAMRKRGVVDVPPAPTTGHKREDTTNWRPDVSLTQNSPFQNDTSLTNEVDALTCINDAHYGCLLYTSPSPRDCS